MSFPVVNDPVDVIQKFLFVLQDLTSAQMIRHDVESVIEAFSRFTLAIRPAPSVLQIFIVL